MRLSVTTSEADILVWLNEQINAFFPSHTCRHPIRSFHWKANASRAAVRDRWAGWYRSDRVIGLNPEYFSGIADPAQQDLAIVDTLLHELCHHFVAWEYGNVPSHGRQFRAMAYYINGQLGRDAVTIYHDLARTPEGKDAARAQRTALALLARTTSSNEHEAALAAAKYAEFVASNNVRLDVHAETLASGLPVVVKEHVWTSKNMSLWLTSILGAVSEVNGCSYTYIRDSYSSCTLTSFYGRPIKISQSYDLIEYLVEAVERVVAKAQRDAKKTGGVDAFEARGRSYWGAFREGVAMRVAQSLRDDHKRRMDDGVVASNGITHVPGLVLRTALQQERAAAASFLEDLHPSVRSSSRSGSRSATGRSAGYAAGASVSVSRQAVGRSTRPLAAAR